MQAAKLSLLSGPLAALVATGAVHGRAAHELGDPVFWSGLKRFTRAHAGGMVNSREFQRAFEAESGRSLQQLFDTWVYAAG